MGAKLFPITPGRVDSIAQQDFSKRASQVITSHANKKHIWQKEHSQKMKGGMLNRKVGPRGRAPSFSESEKFLKKIMLFEPHRDLGCLRAVTKGPEKTNLPLGIIWVD